jgi:hypothetical protein
MNTNDLLKWGLIGGALYLLWYEFSQGDLASAITGGTTSPGTTGTTPPTQPTQPTAPGSTAAPSPATYELASAVTQTVNNALKATFNISGIGQESIAVIPGGDAYNDSGQPITAALAAIGITPAELYSVMQTAYNTGASKGSTSTAIGPEHVHAPATLRGLNALAAGPLVHMRQSSSGKWVM